jgi:mono/diheme cytochrome c family protein
MAGKATRWIGIGLGSLVGLATLAAGGVYAASESRLNKQYGLDVQEVAIPGDPVSIERGRHVAIAISKCVDCHGGDLSGKRWIEDDKLGQFITPNLTNGKGGVGQTYTDQDWVRAIRHGIDPAGRGLAFMPADEFGNLTNADLGAVIAYLKQVPPVDNELPLTTVGPLGRMLLVTGELPLIAAERIDHQAKYPASLVPAATAEYGKYLAVSGGCIGCHGAGLSGGQVPGTPPDDPNFPPATNITPAGPMGKWREQDFTQALRAGVRPDGSTIHPFMPWKLAGQMNDTEIQALFTFLKSVPAKETGGR